MTICFSDWGEWVQLAVIDCAAERNAEICMNFEVSSNFSFEDHWKFLPVQLHEHPAALPRPENQLQTNLHFLTRFETVISEHFLSS